MEIPGEIKYIKNVTTLYTKYHEGGTRRLSIKGLALTKYLIQLIHLMFQYLEIIRNNIITQKYFQTNLIKLILYIKNGIRRLKMDMEEQKTFFVIFKKYRT